MLHQTAVTIDGAAYTLCGTHATPPLPPAGFEWWRQSRRIIAGARFDRHVLKDFFEGELWDESEPINDNVIYISLDPNGGANASNASGSETALVGFFMSRGRLVVRRIDRCRLVRVRVRVSRLCVHYGGGAAAPTASRLRAPPSRWACTVAAATCTR